MIRRHGRQEIQMAHAPAASEHEPEEAHDRDRQEIELDSVALARILAEVRNEDTFEAGAYNRMHNRHNR